MNRKLTAICALFCAYTTSFGAGFQTLEQGAANLGNALAGASVNSNADASAAFWNPSAGFNVPLKEGETKVDVAANMIISVFDFNATEVTSPDPSLNGRTGKSGDAGCVSVVPNFYLLHKLKDDIILSLSVTAPYALETDYEKSWVGRNMAWNSALTTMDINPSIAFKINEYLTVSGGVSAQWIHANLSQAYPFSYNEVRVSGSDWGVGGNIGFTVNYAEDGRVGFQWRSEVSHNINGNNHLNDAVIAPINADLTLPHTFNVGWYQRLRGDWKPLALMAEYSYTMWSSFESLTIKNSSTGAIVSDQKEDWRNTSRVSVGAHIYPLETDDFVVRLGTCWDQTPIKDAEHRYARIPCTDRIWFSCGFGYKYENWNFDVAYTYIYFYDNPKMNDSMATPAGATKIKGYFEGRAHVVALQVGYKF